MVKNKNLEWTTTMLKWMEKSISWFPRTVVATDESLGVGQVPKCANYLRSICLDPQFGITLLCSIHFHQLLSLWGRFPFEQKAGYVIANGDEFANKYAELKV